MRAFANLEQQGIVLDGFLVISCLFCRSGSACKSVEAVGVELQVVLIFL